jgi:adenosylcobinamide-phosphate synthase
MNALVSALALAIERALGYPQALVRIIGHPVMWQGALIGWLDERLNGERLDGGRHGRLAGRLRGLLMLGALLGATLAITLPVALLCRAIPLGVVLEALLASTLLAQKALGRALEAVADGLSMSVAEARAAVRHIVGRDPEALDEAGVARAAIESLAESTSDGVVAPLFWLMLLGLPGLALYKAINTADSMVGHRTDRHIHFGWASARLDDVVNFVPARLSALLIAAAAFGTPGADARGALETARRDAARHQSPNAGWPEAAMAGALGVSLGGPRRYGGALIDLPAFGDGRRELGRPDIEAALTLYRNALNLLLMASVMIALVAA